MTDATLWLLIAGAVIVGLFLVWSFVVGALAMFAWASEGGPIGCMIMLALWIFALPVMAVLALIVGAVIVVARWFD